MSGDGRVLWRDNKRELCRQDEERERERERDTFDFLNDLMEPGFSLFTCDHKRLDVKLIKEKGQHKRRMKIAFKVNTSK